MVDAVVLSYVNVTHSITCVCLHEDLGQLYLGWMP